MGQASSTESNSFDEENQLPTPALAPAEVQPEQEEKEQEEPMELPETIYSLVFLLAILYESPAHSTRKWVSQVPYTIYSIFVVLFTAVSQSYILWNFSDIAFTTPPPPCDAPVFLRFVGTVIFVLHCVGAGYRECGQLMDFLSLFMQSTQAWCPALEVEIVSREDKAKETMEDAEKRKQAAISVPSSKRNAKHWQTVVPLMCWSVIVMDSLLTIWLTVSAVPFLLRSADKESLVLNMVALVFIVEVDTVGYHFLIPRQLRHAMKEVRYCRVKDNKKNESKPCLSCLPVWGSDTYWKIDYDLPAVACVSRFLRVVLAALFTLISDKWVVCAATTWDMAPTLAIITAIFLAEVIAMHLFVSLFRPLLERCCDKSTAQPTTEEPPTPEPTTKPPKTIHVVSPRANTNTNQ
eukprot:TRINITY_DN74688_c0_g1_i1.p1 TRINITY_DN74688_c0_g1~~TRINITY_DN74688_c0_g1_i1.p1  ORF type:complete len:407 (+),score=37.19 TRINITY_DN74688_c0_g1_i1:61-1281(+)